MPWDGSGIDVSGVTDSTAALQAWLQPVRAPHFLDGFGKTRPAIHLPPGANIRISSGPIVITDPIICHGNGARIFCEIATGLCDMLVISPTAHRTRFIETDFVYAIPSVQLFDHDKTAVDLQAQKCSFEDCLISGAGYGIWNDVTESIGNTNGFFTKNVSIEHARRAGLTHRGVDCSGNVHIALEAFVCQNHFDSTNNHGPAIGIEESSANGSTYLGCRLELTGSAEVSLALLVNPSGGQAPSTFIGTYCEEGDITEWRGNYALRTTTVGGHLAMRNQTAGDRVGALNSRLTFHAKDNSDVSYSVMIPAADFGSYMSIQSDPVNANDFWLLKRERPTASTYRVVLQHFFNQGTDLLGVQATLNGTWAVVPVVAGVV